MNILAQKTVFWLIIRENPSLSPPVYSSKAVAKNAMAPRGLSWDAWITCATANSYG